jgi:hypothetical protein
MRVHETKKFLHNKRTVTRLKRLPTEWEKIFASHTSDKGLITRLYREIKKLNSQQQILLKPVSSLQPDYCICLGWQSNAHFRECIKLKGRIKMKTSQAHRRRMGFSNNFLQAMCNTIFKLLDMCRLSFMMSCQLAAPTKD